MKIVTESFCCVFVLVIFLRSHQCLPLDNEVKLIASTNENNDKSYSFSYALSDGQAREETGILSQVGETEVYKVTGSYTFLGTDGIHYFVQYTADENGFNAEVVTEDPKSLLDERIDSNLLKSLLGR